MKNYCEKFEGEDGYGCVRNNMFDFLEFFCKFVYCVSWMRFINCKDNFYSDEWRICKVSFCCMDFGNMVLIGWIDCCVWVVIFERILLVWFLKRKWV